MLNMDDYAGYIRERCSVICFTTDYSGKITERNRAFQKDTFFYRSRFITRFMKKKAFHELTKDHMELINAVTLQTKNGTAVCFMRRYEDHFLWCVPTVLRDRSVPHGYIESCASYGFFFALDQLRAGTAASAEELFAAGVESTINHYHFIHVDEYDRFRPLCRTVLAFMCPETEISFADNVINAPLIEFHQSCAGLGRLVSHIKENGCKHILLERRRDNSLYFLTEKGIIDAGRIRFYLTVSEMYPKFAEWETDAAALAGLSAMQLFSENAETRKRRRRKSRPQKEKDES